MKDLLNAIVATQDARDECVRTANEHIEALRASIIEAGFHPRHIGERITANGHRFEGKDIQVDKLDVASVRAGSFWFKASGRVFKVDDTLRDNRAVWSQKVEF